MKSEYEKITTKYEKIYGENILLWNVKVYEQYIEEIEKNCNKNFDTFKKECELMDQKQHLTSERITYEYRNWLDELHIPFDDVFYCLYNNRCYIKGRKWVEDGIEFNTPLEIAVKDDFLCNGEEDYKFFSLPAFI